MAETVINVVGTPADKAPACGVKERGPGRLLIQVASVAKNAETVIKTLAQIRGLSAA
jgi:hypothetical protein